MKNKMIVASLVLNLGLGIGLFNENKNVEIKEIPKTKIVEKIVTVEKEVPKVIEKTIEKEVIKEVPKVETKIVEVNKNNASTHESNNKKIHATLSLKSNGATIVDFDEGSYAIIDEVKNEYTFQPSCLGDYDLKLDSLDQLKGAINVYFEDMEIIVNDTRNIEQSQENAILNPNKIPSLEEELNKLPIAIKKLLIDNKVEIFIQENWENREGDDKIINGTYFWDNRNIVLNATQDSIKTATIHEVGHALDHMFNIGANENIAKSYNMKEITYDNPHFYTSVTEYIAECISEYYNGTLHKDTIVYNELNNILSQYN